MKFALNLLCLTDQYLLASLKELCEFSIKNAIKIDNVCVILSTADTMVANELKEEALEFILNNFSNVIITEDFIHLPKQVLSSIFQEVHTRGCSIGPPSNKNTS